MILLTTIACWLIAGTQSSKINYDGDQVLTVHVENVDRLQQAISLLSTSLSRDVDIWREFTEHTHSFDVFVNRQHVNEIKQKLTSHGYEVSVFIHDVGRAIRDVSREDVPHRTRRSDDVIEYVNITYIRHHEIERLLRRIENVFMDIVSLHHIGLSTEGRNMTVIKIGKPGEKKPRVWIDGGIHAREWIAPSTVLYFICQLLAGYDRDAYLRDIVDKFDIFFLPVLNPDGYEYTHTTDRLWRKNRRPLPGTNCTGVDLNRNWNFHWGEVTRELNPCGILYMGTHPESEVEVQNIARFLTQSDGLFTAFLTYHSYSQQFLSRWDYTTNELPDHDVLIALAFDAAEAMTRVHDKYYLAGTAPLILYPFGGGSADWARGVANITYSYLIELRDRGQRGFVLPPDQIIPTGEEAWAGLKVVFDHIRFEHYANATLETALPSSSRNVLFTDMLSPARWRNKFEVSSARSHLLSSYYSLSILMAHAFIWLTSCL